jgi:hypothetical protein
MKNKLEHILSQLTETQTQVCNALSEVDDDNSPTGVSITDHWGRLIVVGMHSHYYEKERTVGQQLRDINNLLAEAIDITQTMLEELEES